MAMFVGGTQNEVDLASLLVEATTDAWLVVDERNAVVYANGAAERMLGWSRAEIVGRAIGDLLPDRVSAMQVEHCRRSARDANVRRVVRPFVLCARRRDGVDLHVDVTFTPFESPRGLFVLASVRDTTERARAEERILKSEQRLREFFEHAPEPIIVAGADGEIQEVNRAACAMLAYERDELIGRDKSILFRVEDLDRVAAVRDRIVTLGSDLGEWSLVRKDGSSVPVALTGAILADGRSLAYARDVSERNRTEAALAKSESAREMTLAELRALLDQCPVGITFARGPDLVDLEMNRAARELLGDLPARNRRLRDDRGELVPREQTPLDRALRGETVEREEYVLERGDRSIPIEASAAPVADRSGRITGAVAVWQDMTKVHELERLRAEWASVVAHDLRQPLNSIGLYAQVLEAESTASLADRARHLGEIRKLVKRLARMTGDLLDLSRLEAQRLEVVRRPLDVVSLVRDTLARIGLELPQRTFVMTVEGERHVVLGDADRLAQVLENLLSNAVKYGRSDRPIRISVVQATDTLVVDVTNEGAGIPARDLEAIFGRFRRAGVAAHKAIPGIGLGLQIAQGLVEAHGGMLSATSVPDGETSFRIVLPRHVGEGRLVGPRVARAVDSGPNVVARALASSAR